MKQLQYISPAELPKRGVQNFVRALVHSLTTHPRMVIGQYHRWTTVKQNKKLKVQY
jgi:hypothetical protein